METVTYKINEFEGPLDLLLHLVARHKMELYDIPIYELINHYLAAIGTLSPESLDPTSEFIEMAAHLVHMKSVALLPRPEESDALERELTGQLVELYLCKQAARKLSDLSEGIHFFVRGAADIPLPTEYTATHDSLALLEAFMSVMGRGIRLHEPDTSDFDPLVTAPMVSVSSRIVHILRALRKGSLRNISELFSASASRSESVATFLGVLELMKAGRMKIDDDGTILPTLRDRRDP